MSNPHKDSPLDSYFRKETNGALAPHSPQKTNAREYHCSVCGKTIKNEHSVKYMLCSDHFSSMFEDKVKRDEQEREAARKKRQERKRKKASDSIY